MSRSNPKFSVPKVLPGEIRRTELLRRLHAASKPLVLITAPAGFGKTTLAAQLARTSDKRVVWLQLDEEDVDSTALAASLTLAIDAELNVNLENWSRVGDIGLEHSAVALASDINLFEHDIIFVFETLDHLSEASGRWLSAFISRLGEGHQVICSHYGGGAAPQLSRLIATGRAEVVSGQDLTFSLLEARQLLGSHKLDIKEVWDQAEGWPASLGLIRHSSALSVSTNDLVDDLLKRLEPSLRRYLPDLSVLPYWSEAEAKHFGIELPFGWIKDLLAVGLPLQPLSQGIYRPHSVVLSALSRLLRRSPERYKSANLKAGRIAERQGDLVRAIGHYRCSEEWHSANRLLNDLLPRFQRRSEWSSIRSLLEPFNPESLEGYACSLLGISLLETGDPSEGEKILREQARSSPHPYTHFGLAILEFRSSSPAECLHEVERGLALKPDEYTELDLLRLKIPALVETGDESALSLAHKAARRAEMLGHPGLLLSVLSAQQYAAQKLERYEEALVIGARALELASACELQRKAMPIVNSYAETLYILGRGGEALPYVDTMLAYGEENYILAVPFMRRLRGEIYRQLRQYDKGAEESIKAVAAYKSFSIETHALLALGDLVKWHCERGELSEARSRLAEMSPELISSDETYRSLHILYLGIVTLFEDRFEDARILFQDCLDYFESQDSLIAFEITGYTLTADAAQGRLSRKAVDEFVGLSTHPAKQHKLGVHARLWRRLYTHVLAKGWHAEIFEPLLNLKPLKIPKPPRKQIRANFFGGFELLVDGKRVHLTPRPAEVLAFLVINGESRIDRIAASLWPDVSLRSAKQTLAQHVRRLRETLKLALGVDQPIVTAGKSYALDSAILIESDVIELEVALKSVDPCHHLPIVMSYEPFLSGSTGPWILDKRYEYEQVIVVLGLLIAQQITDTASKVAVLEQVISVDPYAQEAYQELARFYQKQGDGPIASFWERRWSTVADTLG